MDLQTVTETWPHGAILDLPWYDSAVQLQEKWGKVEGKPKRKIRESLPRGKDYRITLPEQ
jgi:hypothetical protein